jgi:hypothetical protein
MRGKPIVVGRGAHIRGLTVSPPNLSSICGKVSDSQGLAQPDQRIFLQWNQAGGYSGPPGQSGVLTDAGGRFRIDGIPPGEYFPFSLLDVSHIEFFSRDGSLSAATPLHVQAGKDIGCGSNPPLDLRVPPIKTTYSFAGKVSGELPAKLGDRFYVLLFDVRPSGSQNILGSAKLDAEHRFVIDKVPAGKFLLQLEGYYGPESTITFGNVTPPHFLASQMIDVHDGMTEVTIPPVQLATVVGTVHFSRLPEASGETLNVSRWEIALLPRERVWEHSEVSAPIAADGSFRIELVDAGNYEVNPNLGWPLYIESVRLNGRELKGRYLHFDAGTARLDIELRRDSAQVNARIVPDPSLPMAAPPVRETCGKSSGPKYIVALFPDPLFDTPSADKELNPGPLHQPRVLGGSSFLNPEVVSIQAVPPGKYRALAMQALDNMGPLFEGQNDLTDFKRQSWTALAALGKPITVESGGTVELSLPDRTIEVERLAAALGAPLDRRLFDRGFSLW